MDRIYLDYAATTPLDPAVINCMYDLSKNHFGNPSSIHWSGQKSRQIIESARKTIAEMIGARPGEIVFSSGGTESDNLAILGTAIANRDRGRHIITTRVEHPAVLEACRYLEKTGYEITFLEVNEDGMLSLEELDRAISDNTILISVMLVNNETGVIFPIKQIGEMIRKKNILFHCDAVQAFGKMTIDVQDLGIDLLSVSAHKIYGPKGTGALYIKSGTRLDKILYGGSQEAGRRPGTENVVAIGGFSEAVEQISVQRAERSRIRNLRDNFETRIKDLIQGISVNGQKSERIFTHSNICFPMIAGEILLMNLDIMGIAISTGSACSSGSNRPSHVLSAMKLPEDRVKNSVRITFGRFTRTDEIDMTIDQIQSIIARDKTG
jgi:cysteine desulfurase